MISFFCLFGLLVRPFAGLHGYNEFQRCSRGYERKGQDCFWKHSPNIWLAQRVSCKYLRIFLPFKECWKLRVSKQTKWKENGNLQGVVCLCLSGKRRNKSSWSKSEILFWEDDCVCVCLNVCVFLFLCSYFLEELEKCLEEPENLAQLFSKHVSTFKHHVGIYIHAY